MDGKNMDGEPQQHGWRTAANGAPPLQRSRTGWHRWNPEGQSHAVSREGNSWECERLEHRPAFTYAPCRRRGGRVVEGARLERV